MRSEAQRKARGLEWKASCEEGSLRHSRDGEDIPRKEKEKADGLSVQIAEL